MEEELMRASRSIWLLLALVFPQLLTTDCRATEMHESDPSMLLLRATGVELATPEIALALAEMIFRKVYGDNDFETQKPLQLENVGDRWVIRGSRRAEDHPAPPGEPSAGEAEVVILKSNCQVVRLSQKGSLQGNQQLR
jgi:NTF2 fold immunity protein